VTLGADSSYELGQLVARLQAALWCEGLVGTAGQPSADGLSCAVHVAAAPLP
jgi:coenzyme F420-0:L-glutamate ligase/coenzyme F420-1:gamma-L-glutamate ligase